MHEIARLLRNNLPTGIYRRLSCLIRSVIYIYDVVRLSIGQRTLEFDKSSQTIVSLTTWRKRIDSVWMTIETLVRQERKVHSIVLVLSEDEFPEKLLPKSLYKLSKRGLEILWVQENIKSYKKLNPVMNKYRNCNIITFDDDVIYDKKVVGRLLNAAATNPECIIGARGHKITFSGEKIRPYRFWHSIRSFREGRDILLTGVGGVFYPAGIFNINLLTRKEVYQRVAPTADDLWYWGMTVYSKLNIVCLGEVGPRESVPFSKADKLTSINVDHEFNDSQLKDVLSFFDISISELTKNDSN